MTLELSPIPLPYGKTYHLFLSFCQEDEEIAYSLLQELEKSYQLKCLYHIRDFKPGVHVTENIWDGIERSMKIVYLVSQKFKESQLCKMETLYGITASHKQCENSLIPVLLEPIEMPRELQTINYVDGTLDGTAIACKIYNACLFGGLLFKLIKYFPAVLYITPRTVFIIEINQRCLKSIDMLLYC